MPDRELDYRPSYNNDDPVASIQELRKRGMSPTDFPCCARPNKMTGVKGCVWWRKCRMPFKGQGPQRIGVQIIPRGGKRRENIEPCYRFVRFHESYREEQAVHRVVAYEGQKFSYKVHQATAVDEVKGKASNYKLVTITEEIPKFPPIEHQVEVMDIWYQLQAADIQEDVEDAELQAEALANATGTEPALWSRPVVAEREDDEEEGEGNAGTKAPAPRTNRASTR